MTADSLLWLIALGPAALFVCGILPLSVGRTHALCMARRCHAASGVAFVTSLCALIVNARLGALHTPTLGADGVGFALYLDVLTTIMFVLVTFVGMIVMRYSRNYLDGDAGQARFFRWLSLTLASVLTVIVSGNLFQLALAWIATSLALHQLLLFYPDRPAAVLAARKKFVASRLGDLCLVAALALIFARFHSLDYAVILARPSALAADAPLQHVAVLLVAAALLKSAQFPLHGWLLEVMETPTPVSALLHAGIINAGGFLLLRFADLIVTSPMALDALMIVGAVTALFGSVVMLTQTSVKVSLAYSTIAQMGFMMLQCGLGAFSAALLHLVAHSLYKAHAFLSSGSVVDVARAASSTSLGARAHPGRLILAIAIVSSVQLGVSALFGATLILEPGIFTLGAIVLLGLTHLIVSAVDEQPTVIVIARASMRVAAVAAAYFTLQWAAAAVTAEALPAIRPLRGLFDLIVIVTTVLGFAMVTLLQSLLPRHAGEPRWQALYAHVSNGFYVNTIANRLVLRYWPSPPPRALTTHLPTGGA
ncbi:MAG: NADH-quinone oxidoreductase subunit L [Dokdonella sp.]|uniref:NADH-quinone oxidoreductase subunit L n=1 Tax=Dokdonella sp. TaxID=2291710 RepID=UPI0032673586